MTEELHEIAPEEEALPPSEGGAHEEPEGGAPIEEPAEPEALAEPEEDAPAPPDERVSRQHLKGLLEALVFVSDKPVKTAELAKAAAASTKQVRELMTELEAEYRPRGVQLDEVAGGWVFRTSAVYAPFVRDLATQKPVRLTRAQIETLAILAYRQPITRPEIDDIRGVDSGPILKLLLERDLIRILGRKDEPGRPVLYGTASAFLELFGLKSLKDLPTLREFTDLSEDSRRVVDRELGEDPANVPERSPEAPAGTSEAALEAPVEVAAPSVVELAEDPAPAAPPAPPEGNPSSAGSE